DCVGVGGVPSIRQRAPDGNVGIVGRGAADENVVAAATDKAIFSTATDENAAPFAAEQLVVAVASNQKPVSGSAFEPVIAGAAGEPNIEVDGTSHLDVIVAGPSVRDDVTGWAEDALRNAIDGDIDVAFVAYRVEDDGVIAGGAADHEGGLGGVARIL